jgi:hypothetical protein
MTDWSDYIPGTMEREIAPNIFFRPLRSWHSLTYAGEGLKIVNGDRSGCLDNQHRCFAPLVVTHRAYWNKKSGKRLSAFLSYPGAMGSFGNSYFWELYPVKGDIRRFATEEELERTVKRLLK